MPWLSVHTLSVLGRRRKFPVYLLLLILAASCTSSFASVGRSESQTICTEPTAPSHRGLDDPPRKCLMQVGTKHVQAAVPRTVFSGMTVKFAKTSAVNFAETSTVRKDLEDQDPKKTSKDSGEDKSSKDSGEDKKTSEAKADSSEKKGDGNSTGEAGEGMDKEEKEAGLDEAAARPLSWLLIASIVIVALVFAMTHGSNRRLANYTTLAVENVLSLFIAILWFQAFHQIIEMLEAKHHQVWLSILNALVWFLFFLFMSWLLRWRGALLAIITQIGAHIVGFSGTHSSFISQKHYYSEHWVRCLYGLGVLFTFIFVLAVVFYFIKKTCFHDPAEESEDERVNEWSESVDDMETDFFALGTSVAITEFIRFLIVGKFPQFHGTDFNTQHTHWHRFLLLGWGVLVTVIGGFVCWKLINLEASHRLSYFTRRVIGFLSALVAGLIAWAFLDWGQWHVYEELHSMGAIFARIVFAIICTIVGIVGICGLAISTASNRFCKLGISVFSLITAWSWEQAFDATFEESLGKWWSKLWIAAVVSAILLPIMVFFIKPITMGIKEEMAEDERMPKLTAEHPHAKANNHVKAEHLHAHSGHLPAHTGVPHTGVPHTVPHINMVPHGSPSQVRTIIATSPGFTQHLSSSRVHSASM